MNEQHPHDWPYCHNPLPHNQQQGRGRIMRLKLTPSLRNEWDVRSIEGVIPALAQVHWRGASVVEVDANLAADIAADCKFYIDPKAVDATAAERSIYRALLRQIEAAMAAHSPATSSKEGGAA